MRCYWAARLPRVGEDGDELEHEGRPEQRIAGDGGVDVPVPDGRGGGVGLPGT